MLKHKPSNKLTILLICGGLVILVGLFFESHTQTLTNGPLQNSTELGFYEDKDLHVSFQYPKSFFISEEKRYGRSTVVVTPLAKDNKLNQSSVGISSAFIIEFYPNENIDSKSLLRTQASNNIGFNEKPVVVDGVPSIYQYYDNAYSGDQNEIWLIPCVGNNKGVFMVGFMDSPLAEQYRSIVRTLKVCK